MYTILKKCPVPITGLILGLAATGNLVQSYGEIFRSIFGIISAILYILMIYKLFKFESEVKENLQNPVIASIFPTFSMATMLLATYIKPFSQTFALIFWSIGVILHIVLIIWFSNKFLLNFKIKQVFPSWFVVYVGIAVASVTAPAFKMFFVGQLSFYFGLITYIILLPIVIYRVLKIKEMPESTLPTLIIFAAPASLLLAGYMNSFEIKNISLSWFLITLSVFMYLVALIMLPRLLKLKFYPSYSAFTFPLIISGIAMKLANTYLIKLGTHIEWMVLLIKLQEIIAVTLTLYVLNKYIKFLTTDLKEQTTSK